MSVTEAYELLVQFVVFQLDNLHTNSAIEFYC